MATLGIKSQIFLKPKFRYDNGIDRPRRMTRVSKPSTSNLGLLNHDDFDPELTMAIQESLKMACHNEKIQLNQKNKPSCSFDDKKQIHSRSFVTQSTQTDIPDEIKELKLELNAKLQLIKQQELLLTETDDKNKRLTSQNETLVSRLERMERRVSLVDGRQQPSASHRQSLSTPNLSSRKPNKKRKLSIAEPTIDPTVDEPCDKVEDLIPPLRRRSSRHKIINTDLPPVNVPTQSTSTERKSTKRINFDSPKLSSSPCDNGILLSASDYHVLPCSSVLHSPTIDNKDSTQSLEEVEVPQWRVQVFKNIYQMEGTENITDEAYQQRHQKREIEEKRRKRWDMQRQREQEAYERLRDKVKGIQAADSPKTHSLFPSLNSITHIEVSDVIPVSVFGCTIPKLKKEPFKLPWQTKKPKHPRRK